jgi:hypothetical protein
VSGGCARDPSLSVSKLSHIERRAGLRSSRSHCFSAVLPHLSVEACSGSDANGNPRRGILEMGCAGPSPGQSAQIHNILEDQITFFEFELAGGVRIRTIHGLGAELPKRGVVVVTGPPCCLTAPSDPCGEGNSPLSGAFVPRRRPTGYRERPDEGAQQTTESSKAAQDCLFRGQRGEPNAQRLRRGEAQGRPRGKRDR